ncbi:hydrogenase formation protein HypD [bacterium]|nr:hydrogenase formation protein HypD [bacterium]
MKHISEYYQKDICGNLAGQISSGAKNLGSLTFMEVCGTHTMSIFRNGIRDLMPGNIRLLSGPGCPVCVTPNRLIDQAIALSRLPEIVIGTFGDMLRVPGSSSSLEKERARGAGIHTFYSPLDALELAKNYPQKTVVFIGIGFETTTPTVAAALMDAHQNRIHNFKVLASHKLVTPALKALLESPELKLQGFLLPGHVSTIIGRKIYEFVARDYHTPSAIAGFEPADILHAILNLVEQNRDRTARVDNCYKRSVKEDGNRIALDLMDQVFEVCDAEWRGIGEIPASGLRIREEFSDHDADGIEVFVEETREADGCICGEILRGVKIPADCPLFRKICHPGNPIGPCMVSTEGTCAAYYKYSK